MVEGVSSARGREGRGSVPTLRADRSGGWDGVAAGGAEAACRAPAATEGWQTNEGGPEGDEGTECVQREAGPDGPEREAAVGLRLERLEDDVVETEQAGLEKRWAWERGGREVDVRIRAGDGPAQG